MPKPRLVSNLRETITPAAARSAPVEPPASTRPDRGREEQRRDVPETQNRQGSTRTLTPRTRTTAQSSKTPKAPEPPREQYVTESALKMNNGAEDFLKKHHGFAQGTHHPST